MIQNFGGYLEPSIDKIKGYNNEVTVLPIPLIQDVDIVAFG